MNCEKCGKKMIQRHRPYVLTSYPAQYDWYWWCGCGHEAEGGRERGKTEEELAREEWEQANAEVSAQGE